MNGFATGASPTGGADWFGFDDERYRALYTATFNGLCRTPDPLDDPDVAQVTRLRVRAMCFDLKNDRWPEKIDAYVAEFLAGEAT